VEFKLVYQSGREVLFCDLGAVPKQVRGPAGGSIGRGRLPGLRVSLLGLQQDVYYGAYFMITLALLFAYARSECVDVRGLFTRN
jgi:hypothetical protein